jgi:hypothetical protein
VNLHAFNCLLLNRVHRRFHRRRTDTLEFSRASLCYPSEVRSYEPERPEGCSTSALRARPPVYADLVKTDLLRVRRTVRRQRWRDRQSADCRRHLWCLFRTTRLPPVTSLTLLLSLVFATLALLPLRILLSLLFQALLQASRVLRLRTGPPVSWGSAGRATTRRCA